MTIQQIIDAIGATPANPEVDLQVEITHCCVCDLLSWVMAKGRAHSAWITVQTHMNVVAVASLLDMPVVILPDGILPEEATAQKAAVEGIALLTSPMNAFAICAALASCGVSGV